MSHLSWKAFFDNRPFHTHPCPIPDTPRSQVCLSNHPPQPPRVDFIHNKTGASRSQQPPNNIIGTITNEALTQDRLHSADAFSSYDVRVNIIKHIRQTTLGRWMLSVQTTSAERHEVIPSNITTNTAYDNSPQDRSSPCMSTGGPESYSYSWSHAPQNTGHPSQRQKRMDADGPTYTHIRS